MIEYATLSPNEVPAKKRSAKYDPPIEAAISLPVGFAVYLVIPQITGFDYNKRWIRTRYNTISKLTIPKQLTIPESVKLMILVPYARLHNIKGSIKRRIKQLALEDQLRVETRQRKLLIFRK